MAEPVTNFPVTKPNVVRFGTFELDLLSRELRKSGVKIKLQDQPFQVLAMLVERPGTIITREEIQQKLWPSDTFVEFDLSLNSAIKKLRQALGDESDNPRFVETLYRRGYRFVAPVTIPNREQEAGKNSANGQSALPVSAQGTTSETTQTSEVAQPANTTGVKLRPRQLLAIVGLAVVAGVAAMWLTVQPTPRVIGYTQITRGGRTHSPLGFLATDGQRIYFQDNDAGHFVVGEVSVSGGDTAVAASTFPSTFLGAVAPDGSSILVGDFETTSDKSMPIWLLPLPAGSPRQLGITANSITWTPDGRHVVFTHGSDIFEANADGTESRKLATMSSRFSDISVSPDGTRIRGILSDLNTGFSTLWELNRDGRNAHAVLPNWSPEPHECCGQWTPDGRHFLFASVRDGRSNIWVLPERRYWFQRKAKPVQLTNGPLEFSMPVPSQDGRRIFALGQQPRAEVLRYDGRTFTPYFQGASVSDLAFSADAQLVAYVSIPDQALWVSRADGSQRIQLTNSATMEASLPRWSPDGKQIAFMGRTINTDWRAYVISATGGNMRDLIPGAAAGFDPAWSPDGKSILLSLNDLGPTSSGIEVLDLATQKLSSIPDAENLFSPRWSPDGRYIAALTTDSQKLMLFDRQSQHWAELARMGIGYPSWSHDSKYLYFDSILTEDPAIYRVRISDRTLERFASLKGIHRFWGVAAEWSGLAPDDSVLITRDTSNSEIYALDWQP
jgi:Tol biopolymer transport system component/DNA-binding winged helix-turn-helix (wHTH) protein